jgi:hypothetical protein
VERNWAYQSNQDSRPRRSRRQRRGGGEGEEGELEGSRRRGGEEMRWLNGEGHLGNFGLGLGFLLSFHALFIVYQKPSYRILCGTYIEY